jgi:hypothetical protein
MHSSTYSVSAYAVVREGCPMDFQVRGSDDLEITFGAGRPPFMVLFDAESFRAFLYRGGEAMREMDEIHAREQAESEQTEPLSASA